MSVSSVKTTAVIAAMTFGIFAVACDEPEAVDEDDEVAEQEAEEFEEPAVDEEFEEQADEGVELAVADFPLGEVTVVGTNTCHGCSVKGKHEAQAQCGDYGHNHSLKIEYAEDAEGQTLDEIVGHTVHYLENDNAADLIEGEEFHGEQVQLTGRMMGPAATLEVHDFEEPSEEMAEAAADAADVDAEPIEVALKGKNSCLGCDLSNAHEAESDCAGYGCGHALSVESATTADGVELAELTGRIIHYLPNDTSAPLIEDEDFHGEDVEVEGRLFAESSTLEVADFTGPGGE